MDNPFKWRLFAPEIILRCVRWYLRYAPGHMKRSYLGKTYSARLINHLWPRWVLDRWRCTPAQISNQLASKGVYSF